MLKVLWCGRKMVETVSGRSVWFHYFFIFIKFMFCIPSLFDTNDKRTNIQWKSFSRKFGQR